MLLSNNLYFILHFSSVLGEGRYGAGHLLHEIQRLQREREQLEGTASYLVRFSCFRCFQNFTFLLLLATFFFFFFC